MKFGMDLSKVTLLEYQTILSNQTLLPSRVLLHEKIELRFAWLRQNGFVTVEQLIRGLSTKKKIDDLAGNDETMKNYLDLLCREMGALEPKRISIDSFPGLSFEALEASKSRGIRTSKDVIEQDVKDNMELYALCDLARVNGIGIVAARLFYHAGYHSSKAIAEATPDVLLCKIDHANNELGLYRGRLGIKDMQFCIDNATLLHKYL